MKRILLVCIFLSLHTEASQKNITSLAQDKASKPSTSSDYTHSAVSSAMSSTMSSAATNFEEDTRKFSWNDQDIADSECQKRIDRLQSWWTDFTPQFNRLKDKVDVIGQNQENMIENLRGIDFKQLNLADHIIRLYDRLAEIKQLVDLKDSHQHNVVVLSAVAEVNQRRRTTTAIAQ